MPAQDPFPPSEFDPWAASYDEDVASQSVFPFAGYRDVMDTVVRLSSPEPGMSILDIGTGTGNLALRFAEHGCEVWCTDFSEEMLIRARKKVPAAHFVHHNLRAAWPAQIDRRFDRIVSAYVFHHFELREKVALCQDITSRHLATNGKLIIADLSFPDKAQMDRFASSIGDLWEEEPFWLADEALAALREAGLNVAYVQVSACAGVYTVTG